MDFFNELKRRNVFRVGTAYVVAAWLVIQVVETLFPVYGLSDASIRIVITVLAIGLVPTLIFAWAFELTPEGLKKESEVNRAHSIARDTGKKLDRMIMVALALALGYFAFDKFVLNPQREAELVSFTIETYEHSALTQVSENSIAVLPFANMSADPDQEYFSDGLAEEILNVLSGVPGLVVASRTSSFAYKETSLTLARIAEELRVRYMVEGSVRKAGDQLRIVAKLIDAASGKQLWVKDFDGEAGDVFEIQDQTANAILLALNIQLDDRRGRLSNISGTQSVLAHDLFLKGRYYFNRRLEMSTAVELFQQATQTDPNYGEAYAFLAIAKSVGHGVTDIPGAQTAVEHAIELAPELPITLIAQGWLATKSADFAEADRALRQAVQLQPRNGLALHLLGNVQFAYGRYEKARELGQRASDVDPSVAVYRDYLGFYCLALGMTREGLAQLAAANEIIPLNNANQSIWRVLTGDSEGALRLISGSVVARWQPYVEAFVLLHEGKISEARALFDAIPEIPDEVANRYGAPNSVIVITALYLGDIEAANRSMEQMIRLGNPLLFLRSFLPYLKDFPIEKTRFNEFREQMGLPGYYTQ
ncbi:MAG: tetratricopeptide repeat protein [Lysobacterales bacterium]